MTSIHRFKIASIDGKEIDFAAFSGKKIMVVNVASECGYTPQYAQLQELSTTFADQLVIVGCPSNDFGGQEPGVEASIAQFCQVRYGVTFPLSAKVNIKSKPVHPLYHWLTQVSENGVMDCPVSWNFQKFLLDQNGQLTHAFSSGTSPLDEALLDAISA
jgi:glutathione peroxidase